MTGRRPSESFRPPVVEIRGQAPLQRSSSVLPDIPFNKLVLSQANVRRVKAGVSTEQLTYRQEGRP